MSEVIRPSKRLVAVVYEGLETPSQSEIELLVGDKLREVTPRIRQVWSLAPEYTAFFYDWQGMPVTLKEGDRVAVRKWDSQVEKIDADYFAEHWEVVP